ncbi:hypothetical protein BMF94_6209 [Rhodotorula taiwanensis]|uniref:DUF866-domain-containing protein n=1 Tax=Rhodotorula taiwanensis TaxID=741276 RepID=A0A2S5B1Z2_9BASI|nr:hypothetical protein BMF94_6209 [Rhodotorula taiwanensis]
MVKLAVSIKAQLEALTDLKPAGEDFNWMFKVKCTSCREEHPNWVGIDATETRDISGSRGEANLVWRCQMCKREHTVSFDESFKRGSAVYTFEDSEEQRFAKLAVLECRGCELTEFDTNGVWTAKGAESGTVFDEVELSNESGNEWSDYDEKAGTSVSIMEVETKIARA